MGPLLKENADFRGCCAARIFADYFQIREDPRSFRIRENPRSSFI
jgi:hypothetical protein